ncbi:hypothetical protein EXIGLDRAFT_733303 [Exidia glandulosa HHB12029]|uniref:F-box domain-containing protein n=1 Tax=Exidia glandulosa HHB12029 TaxID=1314781 RepID=A0A165KIC1_EXIGL|nr:hypothetical protein EXIGLDRAFT_733303 [Exidia glandulosa HHB12029]
MNIPSTLHAAWKDRIVDDQATVDDATTQLLAARHECQLAEDALALAAAKVEHLKAEVYLLEQRQSTAVEQLARSRSASLRIVVSNLPDDVVRCIFTCCAELPDARWTAGLFNRERATLPFSVAAVCTRWRRVALDYGGLWTYMSLPDTCPEKSKRDCHHGRIKQLLSRSQTSPLDVLLDLSEFDLTSANDTFDVWMIKVFTSMCHHADRWRRVNIVFPSARTRDIAAVFKGPLPKLTELSLRGPDTEEWLDLEVQQGSFLPHAPLLEALDLSLTGMAVSSAHEGFRSLAFIKVSDDMVAESLLQLLELSKTTLQVLDLDFRFSGPSSYSLSLPHLHTLKLDCELFFVTDTKSISLHAPVLRALTLRSSDVMVDEDLSVLLEHVSATVTELTLHESVESDFVETFARLRNLSHVVFGTKDSSCIIYDGFFVELATRSPPVWPRLQSIAFYNVILSPPSGDGIVQLVAARNASPPMPAAEMDVSERPCRIRDVQLGADAQKWTIAEVQRRLRSNS